MQQQDFQKKWAKVIAKAWSDPAYKKKLLENPEATLAAEGITFPKGTQVQIHKQDDKIVHLNFPDKPEGELSEEKLLKVAAGFCCKFGGSW
ncbi:MAG: NHLP leader peptide family RiPP precursor [Verrucomicrobia bacterium]|nr:NHLP leader peptide family RiPP precursor [Verrucomicrobiota bacterium]